MMCDNQQDREKYLNDSLKLFKTMKQNQYIDRRSLKKLKKSQIGHCSCIKTAYTCGTRCDNRKSSIQCDDSICQLKQLCRNRRFSNCKYAALYPKPQGDKGWGLCAGEIIKKGTFIIQYVGQVFSEKSEVGQERIQGYSRTACSYLMKSQSGDLIDATLRGNISRFINHSCEPNCKTQKWDVLGKACIGIFALRDIQEEQELTFNYQFDAYSTPLTSCLCGSSKCKGYLGLRPNNMTQEELELRLKNAECHICKLTRKERKPAIIICDACSKNFHFVCLLHPFENVKNHVYTCSQCKSIQKAKLEREPKVDELPMNIERPYLTQERAKQQEQQTCMNQNQEKRFRNHLQKKEEVNRSEVRGKKDKKQEQIVNWGSEEEDLSMDSANTNAILERSTPASKKDEQLSKITQKTNQRFQSYLQNNQKLLKQINNFSQNRQQSQITVQKSHQLSLIQIELFFKYNLSLVRKIGVQTFYDLCCQTSSNYYLRNISVNVIGTKEKISMFEDLVGITTQIINELQVEMGITQASLLVPTIFLRKLLGRKNLTIRQIQRQTQVRILYHKLNIRQECWLLEKNQKLLIKGEKDNILKAFEQIHNKLSTFKFEKLSYNLDEIKAIVDNIGQLKRNPFMAEIRFCRRFRLYESLYSSQEKDKKVMVMLIGTEAEIERTKSRINQCIQEWNRQKEEENLNIISLSAYQESSSSVDEQMSQREISTIQISQPLQTKSKGKKLSLQQSRLIENIRKIPLLLQQITKMCREYKREQEAKSQKITNSK